MFEDIVFVILTVIVIVSGVLAYRYDRCDPKDSKKAEMEHNESNLKEI